MATYRVSWPEGDYEAECAAYCAAVNTHYAATFEPEGIFTMPVQDANDQWNCHFYGPPWMFESTPFEEPAACTAARPNGTVMSGWSPPGEIC